MAFAEDYKGILETVVDTPTAQEAFLAGYHGGISADTDISFGSHRGILHTVLDERYLVASREWADANSGELAYNGDSVMIENPAFVLGAALARLVEARDQLNETVRT